MRDEFLGDKMDVLRDGKPRWVQEIRRTILAIDDVWIICQWSGKKDTDGDQQSISLFSLFFCTISPFHSAITTNARPLEELTGENCEAYYLGLH